MWFIRERIRRWPLQWVFVYNAVGFGLATLVVGSFIEGGGPVWALLAGILFAAIMTPVIWWERKREERV
jgi:hypothetical protein